MSPISYEDAYAQTDPSQTDEQRKASAEALQLGVQANDIYWQQHSDVVSGLKALAAGHGTVVRGPDAEGAVEATASTPEEVGAGESSTPTLGSGPTDQEQDPEGHKVGDQTTTLSTGDQATPPPVEPSPQNPNLAVQKLRQQLQDAGINPEA